MPRPPSVDGTVVPTIEKIEVTQSSQRFEIAAAQMPVEVTLDPNSWMLMAAKFNKR